LSIEQFIKLKILWFDLQLLEAAAAEEADSSGKNYPNMLDKEKNQVNEDPKWQGLLRFFVFDNFFKC